MEELLFNYRKAIEADTMTEEENGNFLCAFVDKICAYAPDIRQAVYYSGLLDLVFLCYDLRKAVGPKSGPGSKERERMDYAQNALFAIVANLQYKGIVISKEQLTDLATRFEGCKDKYLLDTIVSFTHEKIRYATGEKKKEPGKPGRKAKPFSDYLTISEKEKGQFIAEYIKPMKGKSSYFVARKLLELEGEGYFEGQYLKTFFEEFAIPLGFNFKYAAFANQVRKLKKEQQ